MFVTQLASRKLLVIGSTIALGMMLSGCSTDDSDSCDNVFAANILPQSCHGRSPFSGALSNLQEGDSDTLVADEANGRNDEGNTAQGSDDSHKFVDFDRAPDGTVTVKLNGYNVVTWDPRGEFESGGRLQIDSPDFEGRDVSELIDWIRNQPR